MIKYLKKNFFERGLILIKIKDFMKKYSLDMIGSFAIPVIIMMIIYYTMGIYWNSELSILASDSFSQYANFHASLNNVLHGKESPLYSFNLGMGLNYYAFMSYYLGGIFAPIVFFFDNSNIPNALYVLTLLKIGAAGLTFWIYAKNTFKTNRFITIGLAIAYSLMAFSISQSEVIIWLDAYVWFPLVILGINRILDFNKPKLLFFSYLILFVSNYYFGYMIGIFSFLYFLVRYFANYKTHKRQFIPYIVTSILSGLASLVMILPMFLDLKANGETLSQITMTKTEATSFWDLIVKNMIGTYDTTQYGSIPFIYIGIIPFLFCIFYFVSKKFDWKHKLGYGLIAIFIITSFYFTPLDLMWQGFHFPNMFLFRYSFLLSFLVIMLAGYALEKFETEDTPTVLVIGALLLIAYTMAYFMHDSEHYKYVKLANYMLSMIFLGTYLLIISLRILPKSKFSFKTISVLLMVLMGVEAAANTYYMLKKKKKDWGYSTAESYLDRRKEVAQLVNYAKNQNKGIFYRMENLNDISTNDSVYFQYPGMNMFSSVRNRNSAALLNQLGFKADGTALNSRYDNNTLLMDSLIGMRYNISETAIDKFGFDKVKKNSKFMLYQNKYALPLGVKTSSKVLSEEPIANDNLTSQQRLVNALADKSYDYFKFIDAEVVEVDGGKYKNNNDNTTVAKIHNDGILSVKYKVTIPEGKQAYISLFPTSNTGTGSASVDTPYAQGHWTEIGITGQYYNLGYYPSDNTLEFTVYFSGIKDEFTLITPQVLLMDIPDYEKAMTKLQNQGVKFKVDGRKATASVNMKDGQNTIFTTIPYDKGWSAYVDGKKTKITPYSTKIEMDYKTTKIGGLVAFKVPKGKHDIKLSFFPPGLKLGIFLLIASSIGFFFYDRKVEGKSLLPRKKK